MSNLHSKQTGTQLHKPLKHAEAELSTVMCKTIDGEVGYVGCYNTYTTVITPVADVGGNQNNKYWTIFSKTMNKKYAVWYNVGGSGAFTLPNTYDELIPVNIATGASVATIIDSTITALNTVSNVRGTQILYDTITDNTTTFTVVQSNAPALDIGTTGWLNVQTTTGYSYDKVLVSDGTSKELQFIDYTEKIQDVVGAMFTGNTETNVTASYQDSDGTIDLVASGGSSGITVKDEGSALATAGTSLNFAGNGVVASGTGVDKTITITDTVGVNSIRFTDSDSASDSLSGNTSFQFLGGTGIDVAVASNGTVTVSETVEKKSKDDVESLIGTTETNLGTFTGGTIEDSRDIKTALQDLETDHEVVKGTSYHHKSLRYSAFNLNGTSSVSGSNDAWAFSEPNNNKDNMFAVACDTSAMNYQLAGKSCIEVPITGVTSKLIGGTLMGSGENGVTFKITIWKGDFDSTETNMPMTLMGTFTVVGSNNTDTDAFNIALGTAADCTLADGDGVVILIEDIETQSDMDCRGTVTLRFKDTF